MGSTFFHRVFKRVGQGLIALIGLALFGISADAQSVQWTARYNGPGNRSDAPMAIAVGPAGAVYVTGGSEGMGTESDYATIKYDGATGNQLWIARYNGPGNRGDGARAIVVDKTGAVYVTGTSWGTDYDYATVKYDGSTGNQLWVARYDAASMTHVGDSAYSIALDAVGNVLVTGSSGGDYTATGWSDYATVKYDGVTGNQLWVARYNGPANDSDGARAVAVDAASNVYVTGTSSGGAAATRMDYATIKYDGATGNQIWLARYDSPTNGNESPSGMALDGSGNVYVTGETFALGAENLERGTVKYDGATGAQLWVTRGLGSVSSIGLDAASNLYVAGWNYSTSTAYDFATVKYDGATGNQLWIARYDGPMSSNDGASALAVSASSKTAALPFSAVSKTSAFAVSTTGYVYVTGLSNSASTSQDFATVKYDRSTGHQVWVARYAPSVDIDQPGALALDAAGCVYVTGRSWVSLSLSYDYATVKHCDSKIVPTLPYRPIEWLEHINPFCFDIPPRWPERFPIFRVPRCPPPPDCPECFFAAGWGAGIRPPYILQIYREVSQFFLPDGGTSTPANVQRLTALLKGAPSGVHYTDTIKATVLKGLSEAKGDQPLPPQVAAVLAAAITALELDWRVPLLSAKDIKQGSRFVTEFGGVASVLLTSVTKPGRLTFKVTPGVPAAPVGFRPTWPIASFTLDFSGQLAANGYVDVSLNLRGLQLEDATKLRILEWDGTVYRDITSSLDSRRGIITGRMTRASTFVVMSDTRTATIQ